MRRKRKVDLRQDPERRLPARPRLHHDQGPQHPRDPLAAACGRTRDRHCPPRGASDRQCQRRRMHRSLSRLPDPLRPRSMAPASPRNRSDVRALRRSHRSSYDAGRAGTGVPRHRTRPRAERAVTSYSRRGDGVAATGRGRALSRKDRGPRTIGSERADGDASARRGEEQSLPHDRAEKRQRCLRRESRRNGRRRNHRHDGWLFGSRTRGRAPKNVSARRFLVRLPRRSSGDSWT